jgi:hypothetical protein
MKEIYIAEMNCGAVNLAAVMVEEKEKTYRVVDKIDARMILGNGWFHIGRAYKKDGRGIFLTEAEAREWLEERLTDYISNLQENLDHAYSSLKSLNERETK